MGLLSHVQDNRQDISFYKTFKKCFMIMNRSVTVHWNENLMKDWHSWSFQANFQNLRSTSSSYNWFPTRMGRVWSSALIQQVLTKCDNIGCRNGICILLEQKLGTEILYLACRHRVMEHLSATWVEALHLTFYFSSYFKLDRKLLILQYISWDRNHKRVCQCSDYKWHIKH